MPARLHVHLWEECLCWSIRGLCLTSLEPWSQSRFHSTICLSKDKIQWEAGEGLAEELGFPLFADANAAF